jgi:NAD(P)-dependent dehydrogenase (short-subunit alcohol dehydrogenase family)
MKTLQDRVAVVTGAAGGIGRATATELARQGCHLAISDVDEAGLAQTAETIRSLGRRVCVHRVDVSDKERMRRYADEVAAEYGHVHILVNNAGVTVTAEFDEHSLEDFEWLIGINFWGVVYGCKFFLPHLKRAGEGHIVNLSSVFGLAGFPAQSSYCASKFAVHGFSQALWVELREHNIGVTSIHPGGVRTNIAKSARVAGGDELKSLAISLISRSSVTPERCAKRIVSAIKRNKMRQLVAAEAHAIDWIKRLYPALLTRALQAGYKRGIGRGGGARALPK